MSRLTRTERLLLERFQARVGEVVPHEVLLQAVRSRSLNALRAHVCRLRAKLGVHIVADRQRGYRYTLA